MIAGPDSRAQIAIQAAERLRTLGEGVPWEVCPPLPPRLIAALSSIRGVTPEDAYLVLVVAAFLGSAGAVFLLWRRMSGSAAFAAQAAILALLAPSGWLAIFERGEIDRLLFWKLVPLMFLAVDAFRRKPGALRIGVILAALAAMALTRSSRLIAFDALALAEWVVLLALCRPWATETSTARLARGSGALVFALIAVLRLTASREPGALDPMPAGLVERAVGPVTGPVSLEGRLDPAMERILALINGDLRPRESVMWLQALGAGSVVAPSYGKFARELECVDQEQGWCAFDVASPAPPAVLVSRERFEALKPIRGLFDLEGLERYLLWAIRPEAVGFEREGGSIVVRGEAGLGDLVLVRVRASDWSMEGGSAGSLRADPVGFALLDPGGPGAFEARLEWAPAADQIRLDDGDYPRILPEGVIEATAYGPPPFAQGAFVSIFGERFRPGGSQVLLDGAGCTVTYLSTTQINIQLPADIAPGAHELVVNSVGLLSYPFAFEVAAP